MCNGFAVVLSYVVLLTHNTAATHSLFNTPGVCFTFIQTYDFMPHFRFCFNHLRTIDVQTLQHMTVEYEAETRDDNIFSGFTGFLNISLLNKNPQIF